MIMIPTYYKTSAHDLVFDSCGARLPPLAKSCRNKRVHTLEPPQGKMPDRLNRGGLDTALAMVPIPTCLSPPDILRKQGWT